MTAFVPPGPLSTAAAFCGPNATVPSAGLDGCGHGVCAPSGEFCVCEPGYRFDTSQTVYLNCYLTDAIWSAFIGTNIALGVLALGPAAYLLRQTRKQAHTLNLLVVFGLVFFIGYFIALVSEGYVGIASSVMYFTWLHFAVYYPAIYLINIFIRPVYAMTNQNKLMESFMRVLWFIVLLCSSFTLICLVIAQVMLYRGNLQTFNHAITAVSLVILFFGITVGFALPREINRLMAMLVANSRELQEANQKRYLNLVHRLRVLKIGFIGADIMSLAFLLIMIVLHFVLRSHPYKFIIMWMIYAIIPFWCLLLLFFVRQHGDTIKTSSEEKEDGSASPNRNSKNLNKHTTLTNAHNSSSDATPVVHPNQKHPGSTQVASSTDV